MIYLDFDLKIELESGGAYPVAVLDSPAGQAREVMHFPFDQVALDMHLLKLQNALLRSGERRRKSLSPEEEAVRDFGRALFQALFVGEVGSLYRESVRMAQREGKGLRLKLRIAPPHLAALPWEFLNDPRGDYLCLSPDTPIVRYPELPHPGQEPLVVTLPLRILGMVASPHDQRALNLEEEKQRLETALAPLQAQGLVVLEWLAGQTARDLQAAVRRGGWHVFHFIGHGGFDRAADEGFLALVDERGNSHRFHAGQLARLLTGTRTLRFALLNACEGAKGSQQDLISSTAAALVHRGVPGVLAMQYDITDHAAIELSRTFYEALAEGRPVDFCVTEGRRAISFTDGQSLEWGIPVLYLRSADGRLFDLSQAAKPSQFSKTPPVEDREEEKQLLTRLRKLAIQQEWDMVIGLVDLHLSASSSETISLLGADAYYSRAIARDNSFGLALSQSVEDLSSAILRNPNKHEYHYELAQLFDALGTSYRGAAIKYYTNAVDLVIANGRTPTPSYYYQRGKCYKLRGDYARAVDDLMKALEIQDDHRFFAELGITYRMSTESGDIGSYQQSIGYLDIAISFNPNNSDYYAERGETYFVAASKGDPAGSYDKAMIDFNEAIRLKPRKFYYYSRALTYEQLGNIPSACADLRQASELGYEKAKTKLQELGC